MKLKERLVSALFPWKRRRSFALNELDRKLESELGFENGFFIEAGANDGITQSNTLYFEKYHRWTGLLIEPITELADRCRANRPDCIVENCALVPFGYAAPTVAMQYCNLMSLVKGAMKSDADDLAHLRLGSEVQQVKSYPTEARARTLTSVLKEHQVGKIDFFSLDVEGYELQVLNGLDWDLYRPTFLLVEARFRDEIDKALLPRYEVVKMLSEHDVLYKARSPVRL